MEITEVRLTRVKGDDKLRAFVSITFDDDFVIRDLKIIQGKKGEFVAMPSRKLTEHCPKCGKKNDVLSAHCNTCGGKLPRQDNDRNKRVYADIAHPINTRCREMIQEKVLEEYRKMVDREGEDPGRGVSTEDIDKDSVEIPEDEEAEDEKAEDEKEVDEKEVDEDAEDEKEVIEEESDDNSDEQESSEEKSDSDDDDDDFSKGIW